MSKNTEQNFSAVNYLKESNFAVDEKHDWVRPAIQQILDTGEPFTTSQAKKIILPDAEVEQSIEKSLSYSVQKKRAKRIKSIDEVYNIGLLNVDEPITFSDGLNVVYGHNGAGKSSLYTAIAKTSGRDIPVFSDLNNDIKVMKTQVSYTDQDDKDFSVIYDTDKNLEGQDLDIQFFDSNIAQKLVSVDQENKFDLSHLEQEYFAYIYDLLETLDTELSTLEEDTKTRGGEIKATLSTHIKDFEKYTPEELRQKKEIGFTKQDEAEKVRLATEIKKLNTETLKLRKQKLSNSKMRLGNFLNYFEVVANGQSISTSFDEAFFSECINAVSQHKKTIAEFNAIKSGSLGKHVPEDWQKDAQWTAFIRSGINFTNHLLAVDTHEHSPDEHCIYCHQPLATEASKELVSAYKSIFTKYNTLVDEHNKAAESKKTRLFNAIKQVESFMQDIDTFYQLSDCVLSRPTQKYAETILQEFYDSLDSNSALNPQETADSFSLFLNCLNTVLQTTTMQLEVVENTLNEVDKQMLSLEKELDEIALKEAFSNNSKLISEYVQLKDFFAFIKEKQASVSVLKQRRGRIQSTFAEEAGMKEFRNNLIDEYTYFDFIPPRGFDISTKTTGLTNSRVFSLRDNKLADIFSEGEVKIHALADFFAQNKLNRYSGVYIFDDPVNSLDQLNIEVVADRLLDLVEDGNQVFVFTHNIFFANELEDVSEDRNLKANFISVKKKHDTSGNITSNDVVKVNPLGKFGDDKGVKAAFKDLKEAYEQLPEDENAEVPQQMIKNAYDFISCYLEYYLEQVLFKNIIGRHRAHIRMRNLQSVTVEEEIKTKITTIYRRTSRKGTRHSQPLEVAPGTLSQLKEDMSYILENLKP